eukprot:CAMPEP_0115277026 /NCGR_PEP_ID=MMETSP0270-20121206/57021_1 /TAXON_ID=71861 /ORGANISM="Scrippsiella trochoidea, Strain CCMP3099" /LENGTH=136 /DNA_ID=CAMNT_0002693641 /DNA_START=709 /DNA_END=1116 /DNA_ORIENTATION=+
MRRSTEKHALAAKRGTTNDVDGGVPAIELLMPWLLHDGEVAALAPDFLRNLMREVHTLVFNTSSGIMDDRCLSNVGPGLGHERTCSQSSEHGDDLCCKYSSNENLGVRRTNALRSASCPSPSAPELHAATKRSWQE